MTTVVFSDGKNRPASYLVYFNGIEIPTQQVTVNFGVWQIPTAYIEIAPDPIMQRIGAEDRIQVAVFYLDDTYGDEFQFRLLFEGEITGWDAQNSPLGRRIAFRCVSHLRVLNEIQQYFVTDVKSFTSAAMSRDPTQHFTPSGVSPFIDLLFYGLDLKQKEAVKRPFDILRNILGVCLKKSAQEFYGSLAMKHFFAAFSRRIDFVNRFVPSPILETDILEEGQEENAGVFSILSAIQEHGVIQVLMNRAARYGDGASMWSLLRKLYTEMYYEILAIPAPPIARVRQPVGEVLGPPEWPDTKEQPNRILNFMTKPQWLYGIPPTCNVIFPSMIRQFNFTEDYASQPTRVNINDKYWTRLWRYRNNPTDSIFDIRTAYPDQAQEELDKILEPGSKGNLIETGRNFLVWPEEFFKGPRCEEEILPELFHHLNESAGTQTQTDPDLHDALVADHKEVQRTYAEYEYIRRRGMRRSGSVVTDFNPYFIPGFPTMVFDPTAFVHAYPLKGSHVLSQHDMTTNVEFTYAQTVYELLERVIEADVAPVYPVQQVRETTQVYSVAERHFSELLHQAGEYSGNKTAAFDFLSAVMLVSSGKDDIALGHAVYDPTLLDDYFEMGPASDFEAIFKSPDQAMQHVARPVTTLEEYIRFHPRGIQDLSSGRVVAHDEVQGKGAVFWEEILVLEQGPGEVPVFSAADKAYTPVPPDTRADWNKRLRAYRTKVIFQLHGQE